MDLEAFETASVRMQRMLLVTVQAPVEDVERIMEHVTRVTPLVMGKYDRNSYQTATGVGQPIERAGRPQQPASLVEHDR